jgi:hypothetical protein
MQLWCVPRVTLPTKVGGKYCLSEKLAFAGQKKDRQCFVDQRLFLGYDLAN